MDEVWVPSNFSRDVMVRSGQFGKKYIAVHCHYFSTYIHVKHIYAEQVHALESRSVGKDHYLDTKALA
jgi:hypothetical protein